MDEIRSNLTTLRDIASSFNDASDLDQALTHVKSSLEALTDLDDLAVAHDLCLRGQVSLFACAMAAWNRGGNTAAWGWVGVGGGGRSLVGGWWLRPYCPPLLGCNII